jgi:hypothetical protein
LIANELLLFGSFVQKQVREWLATTFTRNSTAQKRRSEDKPKFRSVANAIRAGIMVDRLYRRLCGPTLMQIPSNIAEQLKVRLVFFFRSHDPFNLLPQRLHV